MSLTVRILAALAAGILGGMLLSELNVAAPRVLGIAGAIGGAWLNALQMPLIPLVFGLLVTGIASATEKARSGRIAGRALLLFAALLLASAGFAALATPLLLSLWPVPAGAVTALGGAAPADLGGSELSADWLLGFLPANPLAAAADGQMVAVVTFALIFGFAATRIAEDARVRLLGFVSAMVDTLLVIIGWVLRVAPIGIFALALVAGERAGAGTAGALLHYIVLIVLVCLGVTLLLYPLAAALGRIPLLRFARAVLPVQLFAVATQSSIACLPAMLAAGEQGLGVRTRVRDVVLPMAVSLFRITSPAANVAVAIYIAALNDVTLGPGTLALGATVAAVVSLAAVGLPSQVSFFTTIGPICLAMGLPIGALPLLLAVETVPDILRTVGNVTADLAVARIVDRTGRQDAGDVADGGIRDLELGESEPAGGGTPAV